MRKLAISVLEKEGVHSAEISLALLNNQDMHRLNREFLQHDEPTDVITFPFSPESSECLQGEILVGVEVAQREARARGHSLEEEVSLYLIHGLLHLCGHDDLRPVARKKMRERERFHLRNLGLPNIGPEK